MMVRDRSLNFNSPMDELDEQLERLVMEAQRHAPHSYERQTALGRLIRLIQQSGKLYCPRGQLPTETYAYLYQEALQDLWLQICRSIDRYDSTKGKVTTWVNFLLNKRFIDARTKYYSSANTRVTYVADINELDKGNVSDETLSMSDIVKQCLEEDPENCFKHKQMKSCSEVNFQTLALRRLAGESWEQLSVSFGVKIPTLSNFYQRACKELAPKIKEYLRS